ncbi:hypothetical protein FACUT_8386 [Fusarium acutatum]|uniref:Uncharacterized protein n=1 Tax=Fusarium acutatum TaxID=78861 RepID=A0A8H4NG90_9HYPO|nr:hypothetical protein FACUT_8386 [Fusarium acutatum]
MIVQEGEIGNLAAVTTSPLGDVDSWTGNLEPGTEDNETTSSESETVQPEYSQHEEMLDDFLDGVQRVERQLAQALAVCEKMAKTLENTATFVEPPFTLD